MFILLIDKIEILDVISDGSSKVARFLLSFLLISSQFGQMRKVGSDKCSFNHSSNSLFFFISLSYNANQTRRIVISAQFPFSSLPPF